MTELIYERPGRTKGIAPTRAFLDGVMKYKALYSEQQEAIGSAPENHFIYDEQAEWRGRAFGGETPPESMAHPDSLNAFKSIECQVMDWADDTAYSLHDIVDGIHARYITVGSLTEWAEGKELDAEQAELLEKLCEVIRDNRYEPYFGSRIGRFVHGCSLVKRDGFLSDRTQRHAFGLAIDPLVKTESKLYKKIALELIFKSTQLQQIEFKGGHILERLFKSLCEHCADSKHKGLRILPNQVLELMDQEKSETGRYRRLCDYTAGLTDGLAVRTYKRLFDADCGSIAELV